VKLAVLHGNEWGYSNKVVDLIEYVAGVDAKA
jgi:glyceraldehyde-3-phosphate dehydrogenase/erythrose-4-phosphate dehydrogenase